MRHQPGPRALAVLPIARAAASYAGSASAQSVKFGFDIMPMDYTRFDQDAADPPAVDPLSYR